MMSVRCQCTVIRRRLTRPYITADRRVRRSSSLYLNLNTQAAISCTQHLTGKCTTTAIIKSTIM